VINRADLLIRVCDMPKNSWSIYLTDLTLGLNIPVTRLINPIVYVALGLPTYWGMWWRRRNQEKLRHKFWLENEYNFMQLWAGTCPFTELASDVNSPQSRGSRLKNHLQAVQFYWNLSDISSVNTDKCNHWLTHSLSGSESFSLGRQWSLWT
jgi:hypothetical protein